VRTSLADNLDSSDIVSDSNSSSSRMSRPSSRQSKSPPSRNKERPLSRSKTIGKEFNSDPNNSEGDVDESIAIGSEPLLNVMCMGWSEDGRLGIQPDLVPKYMLSKATPVVGLRAIHQVKGRNKIKQFVCRSASAGQRHTLFLMTNIHIDLEPNKGGRKRLEVT